MTCSRPRPRLPGEPPLPEGRIRWPARRWGRLRRRGWGWCLAPAGVGGVSGWPGEAGHDGRNRGASFWPWKKRCERRAAWCGWKGERRRRALGGRGSLGPRSGRGGLGSGLGGGLIPCGQRCVLRGGVAGCGLDAGSAAQVKMCWLVEGPGGVGQC